MEAFAQDWTASASCVAPRSGCRGWGRGRSRRWPRTSGELLRADRALVEMKPNVQKYPLQIGLRGSLGSDVGRQIALDMLFTF